MTPTQLKAGILAAGAVAEAIRELGSVPSGHLFVNLQGHLTLDQYNQMIDFLVSTGLVRRTHHLLTWAV